MDKKSINKDKLVELVNDRIDDNEEFWEEEIEQAGDRAYARTTCERMLGDEAQLERLLLARKYQPEETVELFFEQVRFRAKWRSSEIDPSTIPNALPSGAWRLCGFAKDGSVISNYKAQYWDPDTYSSSEDEALDEYTRYTIYMIELMLAASVEKDKFVMIFDLNGFSVTWMARMTIRTMIKMLIYVGQSQYPEHLETVFLVNAPYGFQTAWDMISPLLDETTASKVKFVTQDELTEDIDPSVLSVAYGGTHPEYPIPSKSIEEEASQQQA